MSSKSHIIELTKNLKKSVKNQDNSQVIAILESLDSIPITTKILKDTGLGKIVNQISRTSQHDVNSELYQLSKSLYKKWKIIVQNHIRKQKQKSSKKSVKNKNKISKIVSSSSPTSPVPPVAHTNDNNNNNKPQQVIDRSYDWETGNSVRDRVISRLISVLKPVNDCFSYINYIELASQIESSLSSLYECSSSAYKNQYRDLHFNFKKNNNLKIDSLLGNLTASQLCCMDAKQMANSKLKEKRAKNKEWAMEEARNDLKLQANQSNSDEYKCYKCKSRKCKYSQAQTRSADEPMTTFVSCLNCGNRWKC